MIKKCLKNIKDMDKPLLILTLIFLIYGAVNMVSVTSRVAVTDKVSIYYYFFEHLKVIGIAVIGSLFIINLKTRSYYFFIWPLFILALVLVAYLALFGDTVLGAKNWLYIGSFSFQPSEVSKPIIIVALALVFEKFYSRFRNLNIKHYTEIAIVLIIGCIIPAFIFLQKDFGTMFILMTVFVIMFLASPILKKEKFFTTIGVMALLIVGALMMYAINGYILTGAQLDRFKFVNPCSRYETGGYQICNGFIAINEGGLLGVGLGKSTQKLSYIPFPHTDSVFAIIVEEQGLIRATLILLGYLYMIKRILKISSEAATIRGKYIALGVAVYIFMHICINLGGLFGIMPLTGVPLPFFSWGGTFLICLVGSIAIVERISIETKNKKITLKEIM